MLQFPSNHANMSTEREQMPFACSDFSYHELHTVLLKFSTVLPVTHTCFLLQCSLSFVLSLSVEETICCVVWKTFFFSFYVPVFCLIMVSEHKVKHKSIFCKSPELGFSFDQTQWANPDRWKQQRSSDVRLACLIFWHVDRMGIIVGIVSSPHHLKV